MWYACYERTFRKVVLLLFTPLSLLTVFSLTTFCNVKLWYKKNIKNIKILNKDCLLEEKKFWNNIKYKKLRYISMTIVY